MSNSSKKKQIYQIQLTIVYTYLTFNPRGQRVCFLKDPNFDILKAVIQSIYFTAKPPNTIKIQ